MCYLFSENSPDLHLCLPIHVYMQKAYYAASFLMIMDRKCHFKKIYEPRREKTGFVYAITKTQISFAVAAKLISAFVFAIRIVHSLYYLSPKCQASSHLLWLYSLGLVCVGPGRKPLRPFFSQRGSYVLGSDHFYLLIRQLQRALTTDLFLRGFSS